MKAHQRRSRQWCTFGGSLPRATGDRLRATGQQYARCPVCRRRLRVRHVYCDCCNPQVYIRTVLPPHKTRQAVQPARRETRRPEQTPVRVTRRPGRTTVGR